MKFTLELQRNELTIRWPLLNFFQYGKNQTVQSPTFSFDDNQWHVVMTIHDYKNLYTNKVALFIVPVTRKNHTILCRLTLQTKYYGDMYTKKMYTVTHELGSYDLFSIDWLKKHYAEQEWTTWVIHLLTPCPPREPFRRKDWLWGSDYDITIQVGSQTFPAHSQILGAHSPVFKAMFDHNTLEKQNRTVVIVDCEFEHFQDFLLCLSTGQLKNMTAEKAFEFFYLADKYMMDDLRQQCLDYLVENISVDWALDLFRLATLYNETKVSELAIEYIHYHRNELMNTFQWSLFMEEEPFQTTVLLRHYYKFLQGEQAVFSYLGKFPY